MNFRDELKSLRLATEPVTDDMLHDVFDKHVGAWHDGSSTEHIWQYLGVSLEEYSDILTTGDGLQLFFDKVCRE